MWTGHLISNRRLSLRRACIDFLGFFARDEMYTDVAGGSSVFIQTVVMGCRGDFGSGRLRFITALAATSAASPQLVSTCSRSEESQCAANVS